jgi:hypothetical protein
MERKQAGHILPGSDEEARVLAYIDEQRKAARDEELGGRLVYSSPWNGGREIRSKRGTRRRRAASEAAWARMRRG